MRQDRFRRDFDPADDSRYHFFNQAPYKQALHGRAREEFILQTGEIQRLVFGEYEDFRHGWRSIVIPGYAARVRCFR